MHQLPRMCHLLLTNSLLSVYHLFLLMTRLASATAGSVSAPNNILFLINGARQRLAAFCQLNEFPGLSAACCISGLAKHQSHQDLKSTVREQQHGGFSAAKSLQCCYTGGFFSPPVSLQDQDQLDQSKCIVLSAEHWSRV